MSVENDKDFQRFLDNVQYKSNGILRYERVFGQGYVSTGGFGKTPFLTPYFHYVSTCLVLVSKWLLYLNRDN